MSDDQRAITITTTTTNDAHHQGGTDEDHHFRDIHALTPTPPPSSINRPRRWFDGWETSSHRSSQSVASEAPSSENFTSMSREFSNLVLAGTTIAGSETEREGTDNANGSLGRIGEDDSMPVETNPLAIVPDNSPLNPVPSPAEDARLQGNRSVALVNGGSDVETSVQRVRKEEVETKISAWQTAKIAKINNRFKRDDAVINGWENEQVQKATSWMKKVERKLEEKRAKAQEKMQNDIAKARRKAEERRASAESKRGTKVAKVLEVSNLMRAVGRAPSKRPFF